MPCQCQLFNGFVISWLCILMGISQDHMPQNRDSSLSRETCRLTTFVYFRIFIISIKLLLLYGYAVYSNMSCILLMRAAVFGSPIYKSRFLLPESNFFASWAHAIIKAVLLGPNLSEIATLFQRNSSTYSSSYKMISYFANLAKLDVWGELMEHIKFNLILSARLLIY